MKKIIWWLAPSMIIGASAIAQKQKQTQTDTFYYNKPLIPEAKQKLLSNVDFIANIQSSFINEFNNGTYTDSKFTVNQFRLEIKGKLYDRVYFRFRDRYTKQTTPQSVDNISASTDMAYITVQATDKWSITAGKMCADWGGIEFDLNPIDIYQYSDIINYSDNFLTGAGVQYQSDKNNLFDVQLLNSRTRTFQEIYGNVPGITVAKFPFAAVANWRGNNLFDGKVSTIWSYSIFQDATGIFMNYIALGNQLTLKKFDFAYDFKYSIEDLDRKGIISGIVPDTNNPHIARQNVSYLSHWIKADYRIGKKINLSFVGMVDFANWKGNPDPAKDNRIRVAWGYIPVFEFFPYKGLNLKFFANYVGRIYRYTDYAREKLGAVNSTTGVISIGFSSPLHIL